jgi:hypothetical protein
MGKSLLSSYLPHCQHHQPDPLRIALRQQDYGVKMDTTRNPPSTSAERGRAPRVSASVTTVSSLEPVQLNEWQKVIKYDSHFEEGEFAIAEFASLQRYNLILIQNQLAKMKAAIAVEADPERQPNNNGPPLKPQVEILQETLHRYGTQECTRYYPNTQRTNHLCYLVL